MTQTICILGRQPALGTAELESLFGADKLQPIGRQAVLLDVEPAEVDINRLGGTLKVCKLLTYIPSTEWPKIVDYINNALPGHLQHIPEGKLRIGLSLYGLSVSTSKINAGSLSLKKNLKSAKRGVRIVPNKQPELNTAQVTHNQLTGPTGMELVLIRHGKRTALAQTTQVQDIDAYAARDQARPKRDARVGMLPPKLAQIIINLATNGKRQTANGKLTVLDPFCGTGVLLQEALLMGYAAYGTDIDPRMIEYSTHNLEWLASRYNLEPRTFNLSTGDAAGHTWQQPLYALAAETYLGRPFSAPPKPDVLQEVIRDVDTIHKKFLQNVARQTKSGFRMCIAVPAWRMPPHTKYHLRNTKYEILNTNFRHLPTLDHLEELGYTRVSFVHAKTEELVYHRPNQIVARELVVLIRK